MKLEEEENLSREGSLPPALPNSPVSHDRPSILAIGRKRTRDLDILSSSDPPLFSSDDTPPSLENYTYRRKKRLYIGTWWGARAPVKCARRETKFKRSMDSGVWMGSEDTDLSADDGCELKLVDKLPTWRPPDPVDNEQVLLETQRHKSFHGGLTECSVRQSHYLGKPEDNPEYHANQIVQRCLDESLEVVDLSGLKLEKISADTLRPLRYLTKHLAIDHRPPSQEAYISLTPSLHLYLSRNALRTLPGELFNLKHLTVLSLRNNKLTELSPVVADLENLVELNIGINKLKWLPWEILKLVNRRLKILNIHPNPFFRIPVTHSDAPAAAANLSVQETANPAVLPNDPRPDPWIPTFQTATAITYLHIDGTPHHHTPTPPSTASSSSQLIFTPRAHPLDDPPSPSPVPSLLELALRECSHSPYLPHLPALLPPDSPPSLTRLLTTAHDIKQAGGRKCSVCGKAYIVARTEWVEWWDCVPGSGEGLGRAPTCGGTDMGGVPLLRRGCSARCVPSNYLDLFN